MSESEQSIIAYLLTSNSFLVSIFDGYSSNCEILGDREDRLLNISVWSKPPQWDTMRAYVVHLQEGIYSVSEIILESSS